MKPVALILDSEALSLLLRDDRAMVARIKAARQERVPVLVSAMTIIEADDHKIHPARAAYVLSRLQIVPVDADMASHATRLLRAAGLHGHKYAIDAAVTALALAQRGDATVLTSDVEDIEMLRDADDQELRSGRNLLVRKV
nr:PIN domain-containing protein [Phaeacidiphilus oryzae]